MSTIGKIAISLEADYAKFSMGKAQKDIEQTGKHGESAAGGIGKFFSSFAEGAGIGAGIEIIKGGFEAAEEVIGRATEKLVEWVGESMKAQQESFRSAETLHMHVATLEGLQAAGRLAGVESEQFGMALEKLNAKIGEAAIKGGDAGEAFTSLGLNARQLAGQTLDKSIFQIADALKALPNPTAQGAAAVAIFGERVGGKLIPLLSQGSAGIQEFIRQAKESGAALSDIDAAKITAAQRGLDELGERAEGAKNQLTIALAPAIISIGQHVLDLLPPAEKMKEGFTSAFRNVVIFGAEVADTIAHMLAPLSRVEAKLDSIKAKATFGQMSKRFKADADAENATADAMANSNLADKASAWLQGIDNSADKIGRDMAKKLEQPIAALGPAVNEHAKEITEILKHLTESAGSNGRPKELFDLQAMHATNDQLQEAKNLIDQINANKIHIEVDSTLAEMAEKIATFGMDEGTKNIFDLMKKGASPEAIQTAQTYNAELEKLEKHKKDMEDAKKIIEQSISPLDKYKDDLTKLGELQAEGLLTQGQYADAIGRENKELQEAMKGNSEKKFAAETRRFDFKGPAAGPAKADPIQQLAQTAKAQAKDVAQSNYYLSEIYRFQQNADQDQSVVIDF